MKPFIIFLCLLFPGLSMADDLVLPIISITDGDTIRSRLTLPCPLCAISVRIRDIDTPETTHLARCANEKILGNKATEYVKELVGSHGVMTILDPKWDKYGGRIDGQVIVNGINIGESLIKKGLARTYTGEGPKPDWCN